MTMYRMDKREGIVPLGNPRNDKGAGLQVN